MLSIFATVLIVILYVIFCYYFTENIVKFGVPEPVAFCDVDLKRVNDFIKR